VFRNCVQGIRSKRPITPLNVAAGASVSSGSSNSNENDNQVENFDFLVLGSGIAGLTYALKVADHGRVAIITKGPATEGCTQYAQGGICAVLDAMDSVEAHIKDTMVAGAFLNDLDAVDAVCREGPARVLELADFGARFTRTHGGNLHLTREGGHSARRIVHAADATGAEIERALIATTRAHPNVTFFENHLAVDLVLGESSNGGPLSLGADVLDSFSMSMKRFLAPVTMLATGGAGQAYPLTTNPTVSTGDGMAMAHRAKAAVANMEFVQFHPTALYSPACPSPAAGAESAAGRAFLISEAVRGEGGRLFNTDGVRFMPAYDDRAELAPRDIVARAIHSEMSAAGTSHVLLDISHKPAKTVLEHFPNIASHCASLGVDITRNPIPVVPAQHYMCGGVQTGLQGETSIPGLFACGEVACSGLHGANRLASNSLLEGLVFGARAASVSAAHAEEVVRYGAHALASARENPAFTGPSAPRGLSQAASAWIAAKRAELTQLMWKSAGIVRHHSQMNAALDSIAEIYLETRALCEAYGVSVEVVELRNLITVSELIVSSALQRQESRGGHYVADFPAVSPKQARATVIHTSLSRRLNLKKRIKVRGTGSAQVQVFTGAGTQAQSSPKRASSRGSRELSVTRVVEE